MAKHIRGRPQPPHWFPGWPIYVCDSRYNDRTKEFTTIKDPTQFIPEEVRKIDFMPINHFAKVVLPRKGGSPFLKGVKGPGGIGNGNTAIGASGRRIRKNLLGLTPQSPSLKQLAAASGSTTAIPSTAATPSAPMPRLQIPASRPTGSLQQPTRQRKIEDRSVITAAGGMPALGLNPTIDTLPSDTGKSWFCSLVILCLLLKAPPLLVNLFEHDPATKKLLWFSGPPLDMPPPSTYTPRYSTEYLAFLARQHEEKERKASSLAALTNHNSMDIDDNEGVGAAKRQKMDQNEGEEAGGQMENAVVLDVHQGAHAGGLTPTMMELVERYLNGDAYLDDRQPEEEERPTGVGQSLERGLIGTCDLGEIN
jgi:chromatin structure-remodeling complex subunit RSC1/2